MSPSPVPLKTKPIDLIMDTIQLDGVVPNQMPLGRRRIARVSRRSRWIWSRVSGRLCGVCLSFLLFCFKKLDWANHCFLFCFSTPNRDKYRHHRCETHLVIRVLSIPCWALLPFSKTKIAVYSIINTQMQRFAKIQALIYSIGSVPGTYVSAYSHTIRGCLCVGSATRSTIHWLQGAEYVLET